VVRTDISLKLECLTNGKLLRHTTVQKIYILAFDERPPDLILIWNIIKTMKKTEWRLSKI